MVFMKVLTKSGSAELYKFIVIDNIVEFGECPENKFYTSVKFIDGSTIFIKSALDNFLDDLKKALKEGDKQ